MMEALNVQHCVYFRIREALARGLSDALGFSADEIDIRCPGRGCGAVCALPLSKGFDAQEAAQKLNDTQPFGEIFGEPFVSDVRAENGHLLFYFTPAFYTKAMEYTLDEYPAVTDPNIPENRVEYALWRMRMLSRKGAHECPNDPAVQAALLLALGIPERAGDEKLMRLRLTDTAEAVLHMTHHLPPAERPALLNRCGSVAEATQRLLHYGLKTLRPA